MPNVALVPNGTRIAVLSGVVDGYPDTIHRLRSKIGREPLEYGRSVTDNVVAEPEEVVLTGWVSDFGKSTPSAAWAAIRKLHSDSTPFELLTEWGSYPRMVLKRCEARQVGRGMRFELEVHQLLRISVVAARATSGPGAGRGGGVARGRVTPGTLGASTSGGQVAVGAPGLGLGASAFGGSRVVSAGFPGAGSPIRIPRGNSSLVDAFRPKPSVNQHNILRATPNTYRSFLGGGTQPPQDVQVIINRDDQERLLGDRYRKANERRARLRRSRTTIKKTYSRKLGRASSVSRGYTVTHPREILRSRYLAAARKPGTYARAFTASRTASAFGGRRGRRSGKSIADLIPPPPFR